MKNTLVSVLILVTAASAQEPFPPEVANKVSGSQRDYAKHNLAIIMFNQMRPSKYARWAIQDAGLDIVYRVDEVGIYIARWPMEDPRHTEVSESMWRLAKSKSILLVEPGMILNPE